MRRYFFDKINQTLATRNILDNRRSNICTYAENFKANHGNAIWREWCWDFILWIWPSLYCPNHSYGPLERVWLKKFELQLLRFEWNLHLNDIFIFFTLWKSTFMLGDLANITDWSRNRTPESKIKEGNECMRMYGNILSSLQTYFW